MPRRFRYATTENQDNIDIVHDITGSEDSDYAEFIPWGPSWYSNTILNMLDYKDRATAFSGSLVGPFILLFFYFVYYFISFLIVWLFILIAGQATIGEKE